MDFPKKLNDSAFTIQLGLVGMLIIIGLVGATLWFLITNSPFETKASVDSDLKMQAQLNSQMIDSLHTLQTVQANQAATQIAAQNELAARISDLQDDDIQMQQWLMDNQTSAHPYVPRNSRFGKH